MDGLERLEKEAVEMNNHNVILIFNYIKEKESLRDKFNNEAIDLFIKYDIITPENVKLLKEKGKLK